MSLLARSLQKKDFSIPARRMGTYQLINGRLVSYKDNPETFLTKGYSLNDMVFSIVNIIQDKCRVAPWGIYEVVDELAYKQLQAIIRKDWITAKDFSRAQNLFIKALKPAKDAGKWTELIKRPNSDQSFNDYIADGIGNELLFGNNYTVANVLTAGANKGIPQELNHLPAQYVDIWTTDTFPCRVIKYSVSRWPGIEYLPPVVLHDKTWNPDWSVNGTQKYGVPPFRASLRRIQNANSSVDVQTADFDNGGIKGVLHLKGTPGAVDDELLLAEVGSLKDSMVSEWTGTANRGRIGISGYDVGWEPIGQSAEEMQIIESQKWALRMLCNPVGVPSQLLNDDQKAYNNFEEAEKSLTMRACLPRLTRKRDNITWKATSEWGLNKRYVIDFDMSVFGELQADVKETAAWTEQITAISPNEQRELCGLAALPDDLMSEPWVKQGGNRVPLSEFMATDVDNTLNNDPENNL